MYHKKKLPLPTASFEYDYFCLSKISRKYYSYQVVFDIKYFNIDYSLKTVKCFF